MHPRYISAAQATTFGAAMTDVEQQGNRPNSEIESAVRAASLRRKEGCKESGTAYDGKYPRNRLYS